MAAKIAKQEQLWLLDENWEELVSPDSKQYSRTMELFDHLPIWSYGRRPAPDIHRLESLIRPFKWRSKEFQVKIIPARIRDDDGIERDYFPGRVEELVGDALRKLAVDGRGKMTPDGYNVSFSVYAIKKELERVGIKYSFSQISRALEVCAGTQITIEGQLGDESLQDSANIFIRYTRRTKEDWQREGKNSKAQIKFHDLVTRSIKNMTFRQIDYPLVMSYRSNLARRLHKRLSHVYTQASFNTPYKLGIASFFENSGLKPLGSMTQNLREVEKALAEMKDKKVVQLWKIAEKVRDPDNKRKITNIILLVYPHHNFVTQMKKANSLQQRTLQRAHELVEKNKNRPVTEEDIIPFKVD